MNAQDKKNKVNKYHFLWIEIKAVKNDMPTKRAKGNGTTRDYVGKVSLGFGSYGEVGRSARRLAAFHKRKSVRGGNETQ